MVVDALRKLRVFSPMQAFEYVGFGGMEFVDFELIHRELDVKKMVSIETNGHDAARFKFNAPFRGVDLKFGKASSVLPSLLDAPCLRILWLDYECELNLEVIQDLGTALRKLVPGSVLIVSVNAQGPRKARDRLARFTANVEVERLPAEVTDATLAKWGWAETSHRVLVAEAEAEAARRYDGAKFEQLFRFHYADGARMLTWGGLLLGPANISAFDAARFAELAQVRLSTDEPYEISPPILTLREVLHLNRQMPTRNLSEVDADGISSADIASYADLYRWYPSVPAPM
jgi:hypothetical protein